MDRAKQAEPLFGERQEDVVLGREVAVDRTRAVLDFRGDVAERHLRVSVRHKQLERCVEDGPAGGLPRLLMPQFPGGHLNDVQYDKRRSNVH
jgi:hypothetical protein